MGFASFRFPSKSLPENKEQDDQHDQDDHGHIVPHHKIPHLLFHRFPVSSKSMAHENPDQIPRGAAQEGEEQDREGPEAGYACGQRNGGPDSRHESIEEDQEIPIAAEPFLGLDNVFCPEEPEIPLNEEMPSQEPPDPKEAKETEQAPDRRGNKDPCKAQPPHAYQESSESRDRVTGNGRHQVFHKGAQPQKEVDQEVGKGSQFVQKLFDVHLLVLVQREMMLKSRVVILDRP